MSALDVKKYVSGLFDKSASVKHNREVYLKELRETIDAKYIDDFLIQHRANFENLAKEIDNPSFAKTHSTSNRNAVGSHRYIIDHGVAKFGPGCTKEMDLDTGIAKQFSGNEDATTYWNCIMPERRCNMVAQYLNNTKQKSSDAFFRCYSIYPSNIHDLFFTRQVNHL